MRKLRDPLLLISALATPILAWGQVNTFKDVADVFVAIIKGVVNILFVSLSVGLIYGVLLYFIHSDNEEKREQIKGYLLWGVIGLTVTFGVWGIIEILCNTLSWCVAGIPYISPPT